MTPALEEAAPRVGLPAEVTLSVLTVLVWCSKLDTIIAVELDAGRPALAKEIAKMRNDLAELAKVDRYLAGSPMPPEVAP